MPGKSIWVICEYARHMAQVVLILKGQETEGLNYRKFCTPEMVHLTFSGENVLAENVLAENVILLIGILHLIF